MTAELGGRGAEGETGTAGDSETEGLGGKEWGEEELSCSSDPGSGHLGLHEGGLSGPQPGWPRSGLSRAVIASPPPSKGPCLGTALDQGTQPGGSAGRECLGEPRVWPCSRLHRGRDWPCFRGLWAAGAGAPQEARRAQLCTERLPG